MNLSKLNLLWVFLVSLVTTAVGIGIVWGGLTTKVSLLEDKVKETSSVKADISVLKMSADRNYTAIQELQRTMNQVLMRLPKK